MSKNKLTRKQVKILQEVKKYLLKVMEKKLLNYSPETNYMPFQKAIVGERYRAIFSFVHSVSTTFGMSLWEQFAETLGKAAGMEVHRQYDIPHSISNNTDVKINNLLKKIKRKEIECNTLELNKLIKNFSEPGPVGIKDEDKRVDVFIKDKDKNIFFIDITSPKPNIKEFGAMKLKLMRWTAIGYANYDAKSVSAILCMPYNPSHPRPYKRFSGDITCDFKNDVKIQNDFWDTVAGFPVYDEIVKVFEIVGKKIRTKLEDKMNTFTN
jgi:hypothetical protein